MGWQNGCCGAPTVVRPTARRRTSPIGQPHPADPRWLRKRLQRPDRSRCASRSGYRGAPARDHGCWLPSRDGLGFARPAHESRPCRGRPSKKARSRPGRHASEGRCGWTIALQAAAIDGSWPGRMRQKSHGANRSRIPSLIQPSDLIHCTQEGRAARLCDRPDGWTVGADRAAYS